MVGERLRGQDFAVNVNRRHVKRPGNLKESRSRYGATEFLTLGDVGLTTVECPTTREIANDARYFRSFRPIAAACKASGCLGGDNNPSDHTTGNPLRIVSYRARKSAKVTNSSDHAALVLFHFERSVLCLSFSFSPSLILSSSSRTFLPSFFFLRSNLFFLLPPSAPTHPPCHSHSSLFFVLRSSLSYMASIPSPDGNTSNEARRGYPACSGLWYFINDIIIPASATASSNL